jgi:competence protein ComEC
MKFLAANPFVRLVLPLMAGMLLQHHLSPGWIMPLVATALLLLVLILYKQLPLRLQYTCNRLRGLVLYLLFMLAGALLLLTDQTTRPRFSQEKQTYIAEVLDIPEEKDRSWQNTLKIRKILTDSTWHKSQAKVLIYTAKTDTLAPFSPGDIILASSYINPINNYGNPGEFNYQTYMATHRLYHQTYLATSQWKKLRDITPLSLGSYANLARRFLLHKIDRAIASENERAIASALLLGYRDFLSPELKTRFSMSGATHILAVSGLHVGILYLLLHYLLYFMETTRRRRIFKILIILFVLAGYAFITGLSPSVSRATLMFSVLATGRIIRRPTSIYNSLAFSAFMLLLINPMLLFSVSFQLSYAAVSTIVIFQPRLYRLIELPAFPDRLWQWFTLALAAQIGAAPLVIHYFHLFPNYFWLSNFLAIPAATCILVCGTAFLVTSFILPPITPLFAKGMSLAALTLDKATSFIHHLPGSAFTDLWLPPIELMLVYLFILFFSLWMLRRQKRCLYMSICLLAGFVMVDALSQIRQQQRKELIIYNSPDDPIINYIQHNHNLLITSDTSGLKTSIRYYIKNHWLSRAQRGFKLNQLHPEQKGHRQMSLGKEHFLFTGGLRLAFIDGDISLGQLVPQEKFYLDYIILAGHSQMQIKELCRVFRFKKIVLAPSTGYYQRQNWIQQMKILRVPYHSIPEQGAFQVELG